MGIDVAAFEFLLRANKEFGHFRKTLILGRQRLLIRNDNEKAVYAGVLQRYRPDLSIEKILDKNVDKLLLLLGASPCQIMDNSAYEGAEVIHDLNEELPEDLKRQFDTVIDIGVLEHVFNIGTAMKSMAELVKLNGQFLSLNVADQHLGHGFWQLCPETYYRTFSAGNGYEPFLADLHYKGSFHELTDPEIAGKRLPIKTPGYTYITFGAKKVSDEEIFSKGWPIQADYKASWTQFLVRNAEQEGKLFLAEAVLREAILEFPNNPVYKAELSRFLRTNGGNPEEVDELSLSAVSLYDANNAVNLEREAAKKYVETFSKSNPSSQNDNSPASQLESKHQKLRSVVDVGSISIYLDDPRIPDKTREALIGGRYEFKERELARRLLCKGDRVIELGGGMGVVTLTIANLLGSAAVKSFEANPVIIELARENAALMKMPVDIVHAIASPTSIAKEKESMDFFVLNSFEASSTRRVSPAQKAVKVPVLSLEDVIFEYKANVLIFDIEGFEDEVILNTDLSNIDKLMLEIHPNILGREKCFELIDCLENKGLNLRSDLVFGDVIAFERSTNKPEVSGSDIFNKSLAFEGFMKSKNYKKAAIVVNELKPLLSENAYFQYSLSVLARANDEDGIALAELSLSLGSNDFNLYADLCSMYCNQSRKYAASKMLGLLEESFPAYKSLPVLRKRVDQL